MKGLQMQNKELHLWKKIKTTENLQQTLFTVFLKKEKKTFLNCDSNSLFDSFSQYLHLQLGLGLLAFEVGT